VIIEGFKSREFPKIVIGDLPADNCIAINPTVEDVLLSLHRFEDYPRRTERDPGARKKEPT
jgi:molybdopterin synthase catalytic subunit